ncbi:MAG: cation transporter [Alphaproteobacteria bacterium HGW-Alphaproteobacteria-13]|jgi:cation diffusion facilitator family transporter|nr:MAG: cation transporter [Alphaproteobacteria bacterium HGW-Alphaproteobacteria-13]
MSLDRNIETLTHSHVFLGERHDENARRTLWVVVLTAAMMVAEIVAGLAFNSMALLADGFHMATHAGALGVAAIAYAYAKRHAQSGRYSFGTGKVGDLAGFASALFLAMVSIGIAVESAVRLVDPVTVAFGEAAVMATVGLAVNLISAWLLGHGRDHHGHGHGHSHGQDNNLRSAYLHVLADALTSVLAISALLGGYFLGWAWLDPAVGILGAAVIAVWAWTLIRDTASVLLDAADPALAHKIREAVEGPGDARIVDLHVWRVGPGAYAAIVSVAGIARETVRERLVPVHEIEHLTVEVR